MTSDAERLWDHPDFAVAMTGPDGPYDLAFRSSHDGDGYVDTVIAGIEMTWWVTEIERQADGRVCFSGMTSGSEPIWDTQFLFMLWIGPGAPVIKYWGDRVVRRTDTGVAAT